MTLWSALYRVGGARGAERPSSPLVTGGLAAQHLLALGVAALLVPQATGLPVANTLLLSGLGTLIMLPMARNRVPGLVGPSVAFIAPLAAARENGIAAQLGAVVVAGALLIMVGVAVKALGARLLERVMPPVVSGAVIVLLGVRLVPAGLLPAGRQPLLAATTAVLIICGMFVLRGTAARLVVLGGMLLGIGLAAAVDGFDHERLAAVGRASWFGLPTLYGPTLHPATVLLVAPVVLVLVAETAGQVKAVAVLTGRNLDGSVGDVLIADGLVTTLAGLGGAAGTTLSAPNVPLLAASRATATAAFAGAAAVVLSLSPKLVATLAAVPPGVTGGALLVLFAGLIAVGVRSWLAGQEGSIRPAAVLVLAVAVIFGVLDPSLSLAGTRIPGVACGATLIVLGYRLLRQVPPSVRVSRVRG